MQPIHLAIGLVEGLIIAAVVFLYLEGTAEILEKAALGKNWEAYPFKGY